MTDDPDGSVPPTAEDTSEKLDLSPEAMAILYPDASSERSSPRDQGPAQIPPPLGMGESALLDIVRSYATGHVDWPSTLEALAGFEYVPRPARENSPIGPTVGEWWTEVEADIGDSAPDNSWLQLQEATAAGLLTRDEFRQVLSALSSRRAGGSGPKDLDARDDKADTDNLDDAQAPRGNRPPVGPSDLPELIAVLELNDDANEDRWAMASWGAERTVLDAAVAAGYDAADVTLTWLDNGAKCATTSDGRRFAATIRSEPTAPHLWRARPPSEQELLAWRRQHSRG